MSTNEQFPLALQPGTILAGQYAIEKVLGQGGFGITYSAIDHTNGQRVAIKEFFPDTLAYREKTMVISYPGERTENYAYGKTGFLEEAKTLAEFIGNENIVRIYSYFEENDTAYFAMEFVEGVSFDKYLRDHGGKIPFDDAKRILVPIMDALAVVHSKGIVHRDVTPDNIYITNDNKVKLLDFGAARYSLGDKSRSLDVILKHGFAPKEQYTRRGKQGPFTDVYSLGATFYFALTGRRPPDAVDRIEEDDLIPPSNLGAQLTEYEERAILQALQVQPGERFQNMIAFKNVMLGENAAEPSFQPEPQQPSKIVFGAPEQPVQTVNQFAQQTQQQFPQSPVQPPVNQYTQQQYPQQTQQQYPQQPANQYTQQQFQQAPEQPVPLVQPVDQFAQHTQQQFPQSPVSQPVRNTAQQFPQQPVDQYSQTPASGAVPSAPVPQQKKSNGKIIGIIAGAVAVVGIGVAAAIIIPSLNSKVDTNKGDGNKGTTTTSVTTTAPPETTTTTTTSVTTTAAPETSAATTLGTLPPIEDITIPTEATTASAPNTSSSLNIIGNTVNNIGAFGFVAQDGNDYYKVSVLDSGYENIMRLNAEDETWYPVIKGKDEGLKDIRNISVIPGTDGEMCFLSNGYFYMSQLDDQTGDYTLTKGDMGYHDGHLDCFYFTPDYLFLHYREDDKGAWARISIDTGKAEEELPVVFAEYAVLLDGYFYYIGKSEGKSAVLKCSATDFSNTLKDVYLTGDGVWSHVTSDGKYIYAERCIYNTGEMTDYILYKFDTDLTASTAKIWNLTDSCKGTDYRYISGLIVYNDRAYYLMIDNDWEKYGVGRALLNDEAEYKIQYEGIFSGMEWPLPNIVTVDNGYWALFNVYEDGKFVTKRITVTKS